MCKFDYSYTDPGAWFRKLKTGAKSGSAIEIFLCCVGVAIVELAVSSSEIKQKVGREQSHRDVTLTQTQGLAATRSTMDTEGQMPVSLSVYNGVRRVRRR